MRDDPGRMSSTVRATAEKLENNKVALTIEIEAEKVDAALDRAYRKLAREVTIPGFRKGRAPRKVIEARLGKQALYDEALEELIPAAYFQAIEQEDIDPIDQPSLTDVEIEEGRPLRFKAEVLVAPEVKLGEYKGVRVEKLVERVEDKDIDHMLWHLQEDHAELVTPDRTTVQEGDFVLIDFEGFIDGAPFQGGAARGYALQVGSGRLIKGFEEQLVGAEVGTETEIKVTFPDDYHAEELRGKEAVFKVRVTDLKEKRVPELDDEFAKDVSNVETLAELREEIRKDMEAAAERRATNEMRQRLVEMVCDQAQVELPENLVEQELVDLVNEFGRDLARMGIDPEAYLKRSGKSVDDLKREFRPEAEARVKTELVLKAIAKREGITVSREEVQAKIDELAAADRDSQAVRRRLEEPERRLAIRTSMLLDKTVEFLVEHAEIEVKEIPSQGHGHHHHDHDHSHDHAEDDQEPVAGEDPRPEGDLATEPRGSDGEDDGAKE